MQIQQRDLELLRFVGRAGVADLPTVTLLLWGTSEPARVGAARRVRVLLDHGLVDVASTNVNAPNRITLTKQGAALLPDADRGEVVVRPRVRATSTAADHLLASARVWAALEVRLASSRRLRLARFITEGELRRALAGMPGVLVPDGVALVAYESGEVALGVALEVDLGTERIEVLVEKAVRYAPALCGERSLHGLAVDALLVVAPGGTRLRRIAAALRATDAAGATFFLALDDVDPATVLDRLLTTADVLADDASAGSVSLVGVG